MALTSATIAYDVSDKVGNDFDARRTKVWVTTNIPGEVIADTVGNQIRMGDGLGTIADNGTGSVSVWIPGAGSNPASWQTYLHFDYALRRPGGSRVQETFGPFTVTGDANLADLIAEQAIPPTYLSEVTTALQSLVDDAESAETSAQLAQTAAEAARDAAVSISGISTSDGVVSALVAGTAGAGPLTRGELEARYAPLTAFELVSRNNNKTGTFSPRFTRVGPVAATTSTGRPMVGFPSVIRVNGLIGSPLNNWYAFTSDDHGSGAGGVHLWHFAKPGDAWTYVGKVLTHPEAGALQVETPCVVWDQASATFRCYAQAQGTIIGKIAGQVTCVWTSTDCITWTYVGISHDIENVNDLPQTGGTHTGYQDVNQIGGMYASLGLIRGSQVARWGTYYSMDGLRFYHDRGENGGDQDSAPATRLTHLYAMANWNGVLYGIGQSRQNVSGGASGVGQVVMGRIREDLTGFAGLPDVVYTPPGVGTTGDNGDIQSANVVIDKGVPHLFYHATGSHIIYAKAV